MVSTVVFKGVVDPIGAKGKIITVYFYISTFYDCRWKHKRFRTEAQIQNEFL